MKKTILVLAAAALAVSCCDNAPKQFSGVIVDATMNNVTVKNDSLQQTVNFSTMDADRTDANGLLIGAPIVVDYTGKLADNMAATKIATDKTYTDAVGNWTMPDPLCPDSCVMGVAIEVEGVANSINMATLRYASWSLTGEEGKITLKGVSEGSGEPLDFTETGVISTSADGAMTLSIEGTDTVYTKQNE